MKNGINIEEYTFDLTKDHAAILALPDATKRALFYKFTELKDADHSDIYTVNTERRTQFEVARYFRTIAQGFGGRRYVALCWDSIDQNMGRAVHPYMMVQLISDIHASYNKNVNHDTHGLLEGLTSMLQEVQLNDGQLRAIYSAIGSKSNVESHQYFVSLCLNDKKLREPMLALIRDSLIPSRFNPRECAPSVDVKMLSLFDKNDLCLILSEIPGGMKSLVRELFQSFGKTADPDFVRAYLSNPSCDPNVVSQAPFFDSLPASIKKRAVNHFNVTPSTSYTELIRMFEMIADEEEKEEFFRSCSSVGKTELVKALRGEDFLWLSFNLNEMGLLLPHVNMDSLVMRTRTFAYLQPIVQRSVYPSLALDRALDGLKEDPLFKTIIESAVNRDIFFNKAYRVRVMERFGLLKQKGYQEWKYHA
ncbi:MAG: hypothetical protein K6E59_05775 [Bacilli bacterium]|nr:hypothetical protein [Bacilli bacterium]